jgi:threonine-phosphate decarboxylase
MDFLPGEREHTMVYKAISDKRLIVLRSFTKFFALPGLRIGYLIAHKDVINFLQKRQPPWNINIIAQVAAKFILNDKEYIQKTKVFIEKERRFLFEKILNIKGLIPFPSVTNFILIKIRNNNSCYLTKKLIKDYGILIRDCSNFRGLSNNKFIRVAIRLHSENVKLINVLSNLKLV